ncbi:Tap42 interacting protein [Batrachochytrium dendrobatidis]|nr:Tap42 interacting protein [Batrachochytrium dendrobatidis]
MFQPKSKVLCLDSSDKTVTGIGIGCWRITTTKKPICNAGELDSIAKRVTIPLPEMLFGNNSLKLEHSSGIVFEFNAVDALELVDASPEAADKIKVACSEQWTKTSSKEHEKIHHVIKPYDWTYTTNHKGKLYQTESAANHYTSGDPVQFQPSEVGINIKKLMEPEPIGFHNELILFEDELADNGIAILNVRVRVMPTCFFVLQRFFMRVDGVLFRIHDTRVYHEFASDALIREYTTWEASYDVVKQYLQVPKDPIKSPVQDLSQMTDMNWVASIIEKVTKPTSFVRESVKLAKTPDLQPVFT